MTEEDNDDEEKLSKTDFFFLSSIIQLMKSYCFLLCDNERHG